MWSIVDTTFIIYHNLLLKKKNNYEIFYISRIIVHKNLKQTFFNIKLVLSFNFIAFA